MLVKEDFSLSDKEIEEINKVIIKYSRIFKENNEIPDGIVVQFNFCPFGRFIELSYSGSEFEEICG